MKRCDVYCSKCGEEILEDGEFCSNCGEPVKEGADEDSSQRGFRKRSLRDRLMQEDAERLGKSALTYAIIGIFCFGIILQPVALIIGLKALKAANKSPTPVPKGKAIAAIVIASALLALNILAIALMIIASSMGL